MRGSHLLLASIIIMVGCRDRAVLNGEVAALHIHGTVTDGSGAPVANTAIEVDWRSPRCGDVPPEPLDTTDSAGRYGNNVANFGSSFTACIRVIAEPSAGSGLGPDTTEVPTVTFDSGDPLDSLAVDFVLLP